ncbi:SRPBCC domain-containing protein [Yoonia sp. I 8.24]|uniref:SRPBCC family protein n=1 Tax=Yoonia sp. I 8.24 TaxID=1537229 RepID=UPI001EDCFAE6|nr:SRPBCC domain-containing protein [Yoonia sp. I 8.24]MCG3267862.1 SRPBCC domain-containing protein [Yoonia sp. I 8.24]
MTNAEISVVITRDFTASIDAVWNMWTDPAKFGQWYGPNGMTIPVAEMDVTVGGIRKICMEMKMPERTMTMWFTGTYKEIVAPNRLAYSESMCDADGNLISPASMGMPEGTPEVTEVIVELQEVDGKTRMTMTHVGVPAGSPGEGGWNQAFDKLTALFG